MIVYMLAGLGFDKRTFQHLKLDERAEIYHLDWIDPTGPFEPIESYAARMLEQQIAPEHRDKALIFIGHSFGGVMSQELARLVKNPKLVIALSSIKSHGEKPFLMRWFYWIPIFWILSKFLTWLTVSIWGWFYGYKTRESRRLLWQMVSRFSNRYHRWAARTISHWRPKEPITGLKILSIHGSSDLMFPAHLLSEPKKILKGGNHFMAYHEPEPVSEMINEVLGGILEENTKNELPPKGAAASS
jgi:pimeloyl-ACP methyl ester carboxylesterase